MTVQTAVRREQVGVQKRPIHGLRAWVLGIAAIVAAGTGIGIAVATAGSDRPAVIAPDSPETASLKQMHAESYLNPGDAGRLEALKRHHEEGAPDGVHTDDQAALERLKADAWGK